MARMVALLTDFGLHDPYVGQMKGMIQTHAPGTVIVDVCHHVEPFNIVQAGFFLAASQAYFPEETIFAAVVDPGVGGDRRIVLVEKFRQFFLAPDNGLLTLLMHKGGLTRARDVTPPWRREASATFHGRDLFAPLAAKLACCAEIDGLGEEINPHSLTLLPGAQPGLVGDTLTAMVLNVDHFGNCVLNLESQEWGNTLAKAQGLAIIAPASAPVRPAFTYELLEPGEVGLIKGSQGYLELALKQASAAQELSLSLGMSVTLRLDRQG
jgi:S-adenosyl-L-methionine hydrolase (adenosine-forming)